MPYLYSDPQIYAYQLAKAERERGLQLPAAQLLAESYPEIPAARRATLLWRARTGWHKAQQQKRKEGAK